MMRLYRPAALLTLAVSVIAAAPAWYTVNDKGYEVGAKYQYAAEQDSVLGSATAGYTTAQDGINKALAAARDTFNSSASSGASAYDQLRQAREALHEGARRLAEDR